MQRDSRGVHATWNSTAVPTTRKRRRPVNHIQIQLLNSSKATAGLSVRPVRCRWRLFYGRLAKPAVIIKTETSASCSGHSVTNNFVAVCLTRHVQPNFLMQLRCSRGGWAKTMTHLVWCLLLCVILHLRDAHAKVGLCEVESGQSNIILDIEESRGNAIDQRTIPEELPVSGDPYNETMLELIFPGRSPPLFKLNGKKLQLLESLDRDDENLSHVVFQLSCTVKSTNKKRTIPVIVRVSDINDNAPKFINTPYETTVPELTPVGSTIFKNVDAVDADAGVNGIVEYSIAPGDGSRIGSNEGVGRNRITTADGYGYFSINLPHQGQVTVNRTLDYERTQRYLVTILASVSFDLVLIKLIDRSSPELRMKVEIDQDIDSDVGAEIMTYHLRS
ncbi:Protocadherin-21 [Camponotus floridanus]|uniref:Protocadherin-21 n=1 Tax=Camponotus floridanus TaxID=104421 RepID=E2ALJ2_CAMFO|nr:Protocadherin-21 [Camponotus floridanus]